MVSAGLIVKIDGPHETKIYHKSVQNNPMQVSKLVLNLLPVLT